MKWSIIRVGIVAMFMGMVTIVSGMTDDDREQRRAERHQRKLEQYKSGWNRLIPKYQNVQYAGSMGLLSLGVGWDYGRKKTVGNGDHVRLGSSFFFQQGKSNFHVETKLRAVGGSSRRQVVVGTTGDGAVHEHGVIR
ncbi:hypothetical protein [Butyricimonas virosa]|uniref:hypothetical protein n=1 Tax=Butyricimonas virosa TaxID=544645 RepID=UPI0032C17D5A